MKFKAILYLIVCVPFFVNCLTSALYSQRDIGSHYLSISQEYAPTFGYSVQTKKESRTKTLQFDKVLNGDERILNIELLDNSKLNAWETSETLPRERNEFLYAEYKLTSVPIVQAPEESGMNVYQDSTAPGAKEIKKGDTLKIVLNKNNQDKMQKDTLEIYYLEKLLPDSEESISVNKYIFKKIGKSDSYRLEEMQEYKGEAKLKRVQRSYLSYAGLQTLRYVLLPVALVLDIVSSPYQIYWLFTK